LHSGKVDSLEREIFIAKFSFNSISLILAAANSVPKHRGSGNPSTYRHGRDLLERESMAAKTFKSPNLLWKISSKPGYVSMYSFSLTFVYSFSENAVTLLQIY